MLQSLIQKQLAAFFPDQAADLQALQEVSSSVSISGVAVGALPASIGAGAVASDGVGSLANGIRAAASAGATAITATVGAIASGILLATTTAAGGGKIDESRDLEDGGNIRVTGWEDERERTLTFTDASGQAFTLTGELGEGNRMLLSEGSIAGNPLGEHDLDRIADILTVSGGMEVLHNKKRENRRNKNDLHNHGENNNKDPNNPNGSENPPPFKKGQYHLDEFKKDIYQKNFKHNSETKPPNHLKGRALKNFYTNQKNFVSKEPVAPKNAWSKSFQSSGNRRVGYDAVNDEVVVFHKHTLSNGVRKWHSFSIRPEHLKSLQAAEKNFLRPLLKTSKVFKKVKL